MYLEGAHRILHVFFILTTISSSAFSAELCTSSPFPNQVFIQNLNEDTPVNDTIGNVFIHGTPEEVNLRQGDSEYFELNTTTRNITLIKELDADKGQTTKNLLIYCTVKTDASPTTASIEVIIFIKDVNDNGPIFSQDVYYVNAKENLPIGSVVYTGVTATDADFPGGGNDKVHYFVLPGPYSGYFNITDYQTSVITLNKLLDFESLTSMNITVQARDRYYNSSDVRSSTALVIINVTDVDDLIPEFGEKMYQVQFTESPLPGTTLTISPPISATDPDVVANSPIIYSILDPRNNFKINNVSGELTVERNLLPGTWTICIQAAQTDNSQRYGTALLDVVVASENSNVPTFHQKLYETEITENIPKGSTIFNVVARDSDLATVLIYSIIDGTNTFTIDQKGCILTKSSVDFEKSTFYSILVKASDGVNTATATVEISVLDVNDNQPVITSTENEINAERKQGIVLTTITAEDKDQNTVFYFEVIKDKSLFGISEQGVVSIVGSEEDLEEDVYDVTIKVSDNGEPRRETSTVVTVIFAGKAEPVVSAGTMSEHMEIIAMGLGVLAGVFLIIIIILAVYIIRRRMKDDEQLNKAKKRKVEDLKGLAFTKTSASRQNSPPGGMDMDFHNINDGSSDGATSIQENPLVDGINYAYMQNEDMNSPERDAYLNEIEIETSVIPYKEGYKYQPNGTVYLNEAVTSFKDTSSSESINSDTLNSKKALVPNGKPINGIIPNHNNNSLHVEPVLDPDKSLVPMGEKPEITVYF